MQLIEKQKYLLKVKGTTEEYGKKYYIVDCDGTESRVKLFDYQIERSVPKELMCVYKGRAANGTPIFMQDLAVVISEVFKYGLTYDFRVQNKNSGANYISVTDSNGIICRLTNYGNTRLEAGQWVKCKVTTINRVLVEVHLVKENKDEGIPLLKIKNLTQYMDNSPAARLAEKYFLKFPAFEEARKQLAERNPLWVMNAIESGFKALQTSRIERRNAMMQYLHDLCIFLLEDSDFLSTASSGERMENQTKITEVIKNLEDYMEAVSLLKNGSAVRYIDTCLKKLDRTKYLYNPEKNMRIIMSILMIRKELLPKFAQNIFSLIRKNHADSNFIKLFNKAFVDMLHIYITAESPEVDRLLNTSDVRSRERVRDMIEALAIQLLLTDGNYPRRNLHASMLYRYCSLFSGQQNVDRLLNKAFNALFTDFPDKPEFSWNHLETTFVLAHRLAEFDSSNGNVSGMTYEGSKASIRIDSGNIKIYPLAKGNNLKSALPQNLLPWHNMEVFLHDRLDEKINRETATVAQAQLMWREVERSLFSDHQNTPTKRPLRNVHPEIGDEVFIKITRQDDTINYRYLCKIEDPTYVGSGYIDTNEIVAYPIHGNFYDMFYDYETGRPFMLKAKVKGVDRNGQLIFSMRESINKFIHENAPHDEEVTALVSKIDYRGILAICDYGYALRIDSDESSMSLKENDRVTVRITSSDIDGSVNAVYVDDFEDPEGTLDDRARLFNELMYGYSGGLTYAPTAESDSQNNEDEEAGSLDNVLSNDQMKEIVNIIDIHSIHLNDPLDSFNYLAMARILCLVADNLVLSDYFNARMKLADVLYKFSVNGKILDENLSELIAKTESMESPSADVQNRLTQLRIINLIDKNNPRSNEFLWKRSQDTRDEITAKLAKLVLAYNTLTELNMFEQRLVILEKVFKLLNIKLRLPDTIIIGKEDETTEFKTSIIYPSNNNMIADERRQLDALMKVVCGFLNKSGGTIYFGVNDQGAACGLEEDFRYLNGGKGDWNIEWVQDKFDTKFRNAVKLGMGALANNKVSGKWQKAGHHWMYVVTIEPSAEMVSYNGEEYVRMGSSKWDLSKKESSVYALERKG